MPGTRDRSNDHLFNTKPRKESTVSTQTAEDSEETTDGLLLDFSEVTKRDRIAAPNGGMLELKSLDEFGLLEEHELQQLRERFMSLQSKGKLSPVEQKDLQRLLNDLFDRLVEGDDDSKASMKDRQKQRVILVFTATQLGEDSELTQTAIARAKKSDD